MSTHRFGGAAARVVWLGGDQWQTERELYEYLKGQREIEWNPGMERGQKLEPVARRLYEAETGIVTRPAFLVHPQYPWAVASVDGVSFDGERLLEVKCPSAEVHDRIVAGEVASVPEDYLIQCRWYLLVRGAAVCDFASYHPDDPMPLKIVSIPADPGMQDALLAKCQAWYERHILHDEPPAKGPRDTTMRDDPPFLEAGRLYREENAIVTEHEAKRDAAKELLISMMDGAMKVAGGGVLVTKYAVQGSLDWSALVRAAKEAGIDTEVFRKEPREQVRITVAK